MFSWSVLAPLIIADLDNKEQERLTNKTNSMIKKVIMIVFLSIF